LFAEALPPVESFKSPRAWAFTLLGLEAYRASFPQDACAIQLQHLLAGKLSSILSARKLRIGCGLKTSLPMTMHAYRRR